MEFSSPVAVAFHLIALPAEGSGKVRSAVSELRKDRLTARLVSSATCCRAAVW